MRRVKGARCPPDVEPEPPIGVGDRDYRALAEFRYEIRRFLRFSEDAARAAGIDPGQHQLLLAVRGLPRGKRPTIATLAERLCVQHHTAVELVDRLEDRRLVVRERGETDRREVLVRLTQKASELLQQLSALHREQLRTVGPTMVEALGAILETQARAAPASGLELELIRRPPLGTPCQ